MPKRKPFDDSASWSRETRTSSDDESEVDIESNTKPSTQEPITHIPENTNTGKDEDDEHEDDETFEHPEETDDINYQSDDSTQTVLPKLVQTSVQKAMAKVEKLVEKHIDTRSGKYYQKMQQKEHSILNLIELARQKCTRLTDNKQYQVSAKSAPILELRAIFTTLRQKHIDQAATLIRLNTKVKTKSATIDAQELQIKSLKNRVDTLERQIRHTDIQSLEAEAITISTTLTEAVINTVNTQMDELRMKIETQTENLHQLNTQLQTINAPITANIAPEIQTQLQKQTEILTEIVEKNAQPPFVFGSGEEKNFDFAAAVAATLEKTPKPKPQKHQRPPIQTRTVIARSKENRRLKGHQILKTIEQANPTTTVTINEIHPRMFQVEYECSTPQEAKILLTDLQANPKLQEELWFAIKTLPLDKAIILGVPEVYKETDITNSLIKFYRHSPEEVKILRNTPGREQNTLNWIVLFAPQLLKSLIHDGGLPLGLNKRLVRPHTTVIRCNKCQEFEHTERNCTLDTYYCEVCAGQHQNDNCTNTPKCINCHTLNRTTGEKYPTDHSATNYNCPTYRHHYNAARSKLNEKYDIRERVPQTPLPPRPQRQNVTPSTDTAQNKEPVTERPRENARPNQIINDARPQRQQPPTPRPTLLPPPTAARTTQQTISRHTQQDAPNNTDLLSQQLEQMRREQTEMTRKYKELQQRLEREKTAEHRQPPSHAGSSSFQQQGRTIKPPSSNWMPLSQRELQSLTFNTRPISTANRQTGSQQSRRNRW